MKKILLMYSFFIILIHIQSNIMRLIVSDSLLIFKKYTNKNWRKQLLDVKVYIFVLITWMTYHTDNGSIYLLDGNFNWIYNTY